MLFSIRTFWLQFVVHFSFLLFDMVDMTFFDCIHRSWSFFKRFASRMSGHLVCNANILRRAAKRILEWSVVAFLVAVKLIHLPTPSHVVASIR